MPLTSSMTLGRSFYSCVLFWGQKDARDSLQCVCVMPVKKLDGPKLQRS